VDQTWTERQVCSWSSQLSTPPAYGLRSRDTAQMSLAQPCLAQPPSQHCRVELY
jgi:hypothetical protein